MVRTFRLNGTPLLEPPSNVSSSKVSLSPADVEILTKASTELAASSQPSPHVAIMGRVHLLTQREAGGPGVVGIENLSGERPKKLRVHLNEDDYHVALRAHDRNDAVVIEGQMEREGNIHWIYNGTFCQCIGFYRRRVIRNSPAQAFADLHLIVSNKF